MTHKLKLSDQPDMVISSPLNNEFKVFWNEGEYIVSRSFKTEQDMLTAYPECLTR